MTFCVVHRAGGAFGTTRHPLFRGSLPACTQTDRTRDQNRDQSGGNGAGDDEHVSMMVLGIVTVKKSWSGAEVDRGVFQGLADPAASMIHLQRSDQRAAHVLVRRLTVHHDSLQG